MSPRSKDRANVLALRRREKMARSAHAYMRGNTVKFYDWLASTAARKLPEGPAVWICGDCHVGNLGPVADIDGAVKIQIRDLDQTVIGNPAHDLIRLGLSLATAVRSSNLPGVTSAHMIEDMVDGYATAFADEPKRKRIVRAEGKGIHRLMREALRRRWKNLAKERIKDIRPTIPRGEKFWHLSKAEQAELVKFAKSDRVRDLVTSLRSRTGDAKVKFLDAAYWVKGCSSLGRLRYAVLLGVDDEDPDNGGICFLDIKEATAAAAPRANNAKMPRDHAARVVEGARNLAPNLGDRMLAARFANRPVVVRELLPQDLKLEMDQLTREEVAKAGRFLANVVGRAHAAQMDHGMRKKWHATLEANRTKSLDAPSWLWTSIVDLVGAHEAGYLDHCRRYQLGNGVSSRTALPG